MFLYDLSINSQHFLRYLIKADMDLHTRPSNSKFD